MKKNISDRSSRKTKAAIAAGLALTLIVGSLAYFTSSSKIENQLETGKYGTKTVEEFTPSQKIEPGATITKKVEAKNTGDYGLVVRVRLDEKWVRGTDDLITIESDVAIDTVTYNPAGTDPQSWIANQTSDDDGTVADDETVMYKLLAGVDDNTWVKGDDGYYYFKDILGAGKTTSKLLESLTLASNVDLGIYDSLEYYSTADKTEIETLTVAYDAAVAAGDKAEIAAAAAALEATYAWVEVTGDLPDDGSVTFRKTETNLKDGYEGYADADYTLTVTTEVCQATAEAVLEEWGMKGQNMLSIKEAWGLPSN